MGHRTTRPPGRPKKQSKAPSWTFITFAILGLILLLWIAIVVSSQPMKPPLQ